MRQPLAEQLRLRVSDVKQFFYCRRVLYYNYVVPVDRVISHKMQQGRAEHLELDRLEARRTLARYHLREGERRFHVAMSSARLGLSGVLDLLLITPSGLYPVEFKATSGLPALGHKYQLAAYGMLVEEAFGASVRAGFLYLTPGKRLTLVPLTDNVRLHVHRVLTSIRKQIADAVFPEPPARRGRCTDCEFRRYCKDVG